MKSNELRIGNYIYQGEIYKESKVTSYELYNFDIKQKGCVVAGYYKDWKPIPLTEEWLVKFGFEKKGDNYGYLFGFFLHTYDGVYEMEIGGSSDSDRNHWVKLPYVHTLQNLYFALTGEELTLNNK